MLSITDLKIGTKLILDNDPYVVLSYSHSKMGRGGAVVKTKLKNLKSGATIDKTFQGADKVDEADLSKKTVTYLYSDSTNSFFMDNESYEQFELSLDKIGDNKNYLVENSAVEMLFFKGEAINLELPIKMIFVVTEAPPAVKGNSQGSITKKATIETGALIDVPIFIKEHDKIVVDTRNGSYVERAQ